LLKRACRRGHRRPVRHGHQREIATDIGPVTVRCPGCATASGKGANASESPSAILPPHARRSKSLEVLIPNLLRQACLDRRHRGGNGGAALAKMPAGVSLELAGESTTCAMPPVIIGPTAEGKKELVALIDGVRESAQSWSERRRWLTMGAADGVLDQPVSDSLADACLFGR
jgi:putative transposase